MATRDDEILAIAGALSAATGRYAANEISATEFVQELTGYMSDDIVFWSNYTPSWEPLRPLFVERRGIDEIVARYLGDGDQDRLLRRAHHQHQNVPGPGTHRSGVPSLSSRQKEQRHRSELRGRRHHRCL